MHLTLAFFLIKKKKKITNQCHEVGFSLFFYCFFFNTKRQTYFSIHYLQ